MIDDPKPKKWVHRMFAHRRKKFKNRKYPDKIDVDKVVRSFRRHKIIQPRPWQLVALSKGISSIIRMPSIWQPDDQFSGFIRPWRFGEKDYKLGEYGVYVTDGSGTTWLTRVLKCHLGEVGTVLRVREYWSVQRVFDDVRTTHLKEKSKEWGIPIKFFYEANGYHPEAGKLRDPSLLPFWGIRCKIRITGLKLERFSEISEKDILKEADVKADPDCKVCKGTGQFPREVNEFGGRCTCYYTYVDRYIKHWDSYWYKIYKSYNNPFTWAITYKIVE